MTVIEAQHINLVKYANYNTEINYDYNSADSNFKIVTKKYDTEDPSLLGPDQLLIQTLYLSNDPAQKGWWAPYKSYHPIAELNTPAPARGIAKVIKSTSSKFKAGDVVHAKVDWTTYNIVDADYNVAPLDPTKVQSLSQYLSVFGSTTLTAYLAAFKYSQVTPEDTDKVWLITGAAGAVGSALVHIVANVFKPKKIVAVAGGAEKVKYVESLGDKVVGVDYRSKTYDADFKKALDGDEINIFVDQVGGDILNKALAYVATHGRILQVGAISRYNKGGEAFNFSNYNLVITRRLTIQGFVIVDDAQDFGKIIQHLIELFTSGKLDISKFRETVVDATGDKFSKIPELWTGLFDGKNTGKYITKVADYKPTSHI